MLDLAPCTYVDATCRINEDKNTRTSSEPAGNLHLLLIPAGKRPYLAAEAARLNLQGFYLLRSKLPRAHNIPKAVWRERPKTREHNIVSNRLILNETITSILRHQPHPEGNRLLRVAYGDGLSTDLNLTFYCSRPSAIEGEC